MRPGDSLDWTSEPKAQAQRITMKIQQRKYVLSKFLVQLKLKAVQ